MFSSITEKLRFSNRLRVRALRLTLAALGAYFTILGTLALFLPATLTATVAHGNALTCRPVVQYIGPMALPFGVVLFGAIRDPLRQVFIIQSFIVFAISELPLELYLAANKLFPVAACFIDGTIVGVGMVLLITALPNKSRLVSVRQDEGPERYHTSDVLFRFTMWVLFLYLALGWFWAIFLPSLMAHLLDYEMDQGCIQWLQFNGPIALAMGAAFVLPVGRLSSHRCPLLVLGILGCTLELALDMYLLVKRVAQFWALALDLSIVIGCLACFVYLTRLTLCMRSPHYLEKNNGRRGP